MGIHPPNSPCLNPVLGIGHGCDLMYNGCMIENNHTILNGPVGRILVIGLWLLTAVLAAWEIFIVRALVVRLTTKLLMSLGGLSLIMANVWAYRTGAVAVLVMGVFALAIVLGGMDMQMERIAVLKSLARRLSK